MGLKAFGVYVASQPIGGWINVILRDAVENAFTPLEMAQYGINCCLISVAILPVMGGAVYLLNKFTGSDDDAKDNTEATKMQKQIGTAWLWLFVGDIILFHAGAVGIAYGVSGRCASLVRNKYIVSGIRDFI